MRKASDIGLRKARLIRSMGADQRLEFIADGLPMLFASAKSLAEGCRALKQFPREAKVLETICEEECAKILILVDIVRCPNKRVPERIGPMMDWFYDHLARLLYSAAQTWKPVDAEQLQDYIDCNRKCHGLEGAYGECILPNWVLFERESSLYADVWVAEDGDPMWVSPTMLCDHICLSDYMPASFRVAEALEAFGVFSIGGLKIMSEIWGAYEFGGESMERFPHPRDLYQDLEKRLNAASLISDRATFANMHDLRSNWQCPMYNMDLSRLSITLEELREEREARISCRWP